MQENILTKSKHIPQHLKKGSKIVLPNLVIILFFIASITFVNITINSTNSVFALEYQSATTIDFTINPTISLTVSGDLTIDNLTPGSSSDSNIITIDASSNAIAGYALYATVGSSTYNSQELRRNGTDTINKFSNLTTTKATLSDFNSNDWGYSYSTDSGTTWVSGNTGNTTNGYNGLPFYDTIGVRLVNTSTPGSSTINFKIGAKTSDTQPSGNYTNVVNFIGVAAPNPQPIYMQNATIADCGKDMVDSRDNSIYTTAKINDICWMTRNLGITGIVTADKSNFSGSNFNISAGSLTSGNSYTEARANSSGNIEYGAYYNYCAASAGTVCSGTEQKDATTDICPKNWRLPNKDELSALSEKNPYFTSALAGRYANGSLTIAAGNGGYWWSSTADNTFASDQIVLGYGKTADNWYTGANYKYYGSSIRCVKSS